MREETFCILTGEGKCSLLAAIASPGASKASAGTPNVAPSKEARDPPNEWPIIQTLESGYIYVKLLYRFCA